MGYPKDFSILARTQKIYVIAQLHQIEVQIISLLQQGDKQGISLAYQNYGQALLGIIYKIIPTPELAEEVLQDTFVKIWKYAKQYDSSKGRLYTWFVNIARNTAIDKVRSAGFRKDQKTGSIENLVNTDNAGAEEITLADSGLRTVIQSLDEKYRLLIDLVYFQGYSQREIERELNIPLGTVKTRLRAAMTELRTKLGKDYANHLLTILMVFLFDLLSQL